MASVYDDDGVPDGTVTYGRNIGGTGKAEVIRKVNSRPGKFRVHYRYDVLLEVDHDWQARAIVAILNAE